MTKITKGCYVKTSEIKDTEEWKRVIDAFVEAGFTEYEGYSEVCDISYDNYWEAWDFVGVNLCGDIYHWDEGYVGGFLELSVQEVLDTLEKPEPYLCTDWDAEEQPVPDMSHITVSKRPTPIEYKFVNDLSINMNQTKEERVSELGQESWILGGIEPTGTYVFYREKSQEEI